MAKKPNYQKLKKEVSSAFQLLRRLECVDDNGHAPCPTCGKVTHWEEGDGGHCVPRAITETLLDPRNVYLQCTYCNQYEMSRLSVIERYFDYIESLHGTEVVEELKEKESAKRSVKWTAVDLVEKLAQYDAKIEVELERVGGRDKRQRLGLWEYKPLYKELKEKFRRCLP